MVSIALSSRASDSAGAQREGGAAEDDPDRGDEERDREGRGDRAEGAREGGPDDGRTKISQTWFASQTGPIARWAWSRIAAASCAPPAVRCQKPAPKSAPASTV